MPEKKLKKYSYIKKPLAKNGWYALFTTLFALLLFGADIYISVRAGGQAPMLAGALGISSMLFSVMAVIFAAFGLKEPETAHLLSYISIGIDVIMLILWAGIIFLGAL